MKNTILIHVLLVACNSLFFISVQAQTFTLGPKLGANYSTIILKEEFQSNGTTFKYATDRAQTGIVAGAFLRLRGKRWGIQPEFLFSQSASSIKLSSATTEDMQTVKFNRIDIPVMVSYFVRKNFRLQAGPVYTLRNSTLLNYKQLWTDFQKKSDRGTFGAQAGIGFDVWRFTFDLRYECSLSKLSTELKVGEQSFVFDSRNSALQATLGFKLIK